MENKRMRSGNWTKEEKETLLELVRERVAVIESKACDGRINKRKQENWQEIVRQFEGKHGPGRGMIRVKEQWKRMKLMSKQNISRAYHKGNDGGVVMPPTEIDYKIMDLMSGQFTQDCSTYDSDNKETLNYIEGSSAIHKEVTECSPSMANVRQSSVADKVGEREEVLILEESPCAEVQVSLGDSSEILEMRDGIGHSSLSSVGEASVSDHGCKRKGAEMSAYEEAMYGLFAEKISTEIKILNDKARREEEIHRGEVEIQELQKMYWRQRINKK